MRVRDGTPMKKYYKSWRIIQFFNKIASKSFDLMKILLLFALLSGWDKFDVEAELEKIDESASDASSEPEPQKAEPIATSGAGLSKTSGAPKNMRIQVKGVRGVAPKVNATKQKDV